MEIELLERGVKRGLKFANELSVSIDEAFCPLMNDRLVIRVVHFQQSRENRVKLAGIHQWSEKIHNALRIAARHGVSTSYLTAR